MALLKINFQSQDSKYYGLNLGVTAANLNHDNLCIGLSHRPDRTQKSRLYFTYAKNSFF